MAYRIGSFNVKNLSLATGRDLDRIANIILSNKFDIVAMQEVLGEGKILTGINAKSVSGQAKAYDYSLKKRLGDNWDICWRDPGTRAKNYPFLGDDSRGEGYAFLWNTKRVDIPLDEKANKIYPKIFRNYKTNKEEGFIRLIRDPCVGRFVIKGRPAEIRLITTHIVYGKPKEENMNVNLDFGAIEMRKNEFKILAGQIYPRISEYYKDINCTAPYTIILGDYNLPDDIFMIGGKTGTTGEAGSCLIILTKNSEGKEYISVVLNAKTKDILYNTMSDLLEKTHK